MFLSCCSRILQRAYRLGTPGRGIPACSSILFALPSCPSSPFSASSRSFQNDETENATEDERILKLSQYVANGDLEKSMRLYSTLPMFLPRSDFKLTCSLMQQLGERCSIPDLENVFSKILKMRLTRKHALTFRCLVRVAYEMKDPALIERLYGTACEEGIYVNNAFLNDIVIDCLFSLDAYPTICRIFESIQVGFSFPSHFQSLADEGALFPSFNNHSSQSILTAFMCQGRNDLLVFFLQRIKTKWRIPAPLTDYIVSNAPKDHSLSTLFDVCIESQPVAPPPPSHT